ncbi:GNAT family N-acetyltransferase [Paenibacillus macerans]|uniref:GNAT family N-acetyltransferase n=1 Tax=Paenibacillus macerans TaxID=44252 RepID=UPI002041C793|nr:GNAT family N-acetyltransferase [Paenibacillus macerans]MCM3704036.1 GNAT family N-acetyltransferase [Paenibacillus macerans]
MITYREIKEEDAERHLKLCLKLDQETKFMLLEPDERKTSAKAHQERIRAITGSPNSTIIVAEDNDELVGYLAVNGGGANKIKHLGHIVIGILKDYTGKGVGTALFQAAEAWRTRSGSGITKFELTVMVPNEPAVALYKKMGFEIEGTKKNSIRMDEKYIDEYYMGKTF